MKLKQKTACLLAAAMFMASFGSAGIAYDADAAAKAPKLSTAKKSAEEGKSFTLKIKKKGIKITKTTWKTSKKKVASLSKPSKTSVKVKAKKAGTAKITAAVKYKAGGKSAAKKLTCKVTVKKASVPSGTQTAAVQNTQQNPTGQVIQTSAPTPEPTPAPYYYDYEYFAMYNGNVSDKHENFYVNFVLSDSWQTNTKTSAIESLDFIIDSSQPLSIDIYVAEYNCDMENAEKIATVTTDGTKGQNISLTDEIKGNGAIAAFDRTGNGRLSFGFTTSDGSGEFVLHDMYVNYYNNNTRAISHHKAAISVVTSAIGSATTEYERDKKAADDEDRDFDATLQDYMDRKPEGLFEARPKDATDAINDYSSLAKITEAKGYKFGTCVTYSQIKNDPEFCKLLAHHCDSITAMN